MFQLLKKYRKGVSPVIAIVLLIALTVAAAAVIWTLTSGILDDATGESVNVKSASGSINATGDELVATLILDASSEATLNSATIISPSVTVTTTVIAVGGAVTGDLIAGDNSVVITFTAAPGTFTSGTFKINLNWNVEGDDPQITEVSVSAS